MTKYWDNLFLSHWLRGLQLSDNRIQMTESLIHRKRVHLSIYTLTRFKRHLQIMSGDFDRQWIGDHLVGAVLVFHPCGMRQGHPDRTSIHQKFDVHRVSVPRSNRHDKRLIDTMHIP